MASWRPHSLVEKSWSTLVSSRWRTVAYVVLHAQISSCSLIPGVFTPHRPRLGWHRSLLSNAAVYLSGGDTKSQQSVNCGFRVCFSAGAEYISAFSLSSCWRKMTPASYHPPRTALVATLSTSNSSTSQTDIIRNPKVNNLIISSAQRLVCRRSDSRKSAAQIHAGKMPDFKKETGRDPEERVLPNPSLVTYFGPSVLQ